MSEINFQLPDGPFSINQYYDYDERGNEFDIHEVYKNDELVKTFEASAHSDWDSSLDAKYYVAEELVNKYPEFLDKEGYYSSSLPFEKQIPISDLINIVQEGINDSQKEVDRCLEEFRINNFENLKEKYYDSEEIDKMVIQRLLPDDYSKLNLLNSEFESKNQIYDKEKQLHDVKELPGFFNVFKRVAYYKEEKQLRSKAEELQDLKQQIIKQEAELSAKIQENSSSIRDKTYRLYNANGDYIGFKGYVKDLGEIQSKLTLINNMDSTIALRKNIYDTSNLIDQSKSIINQANEIKAKELVRSVTTQPEIKQSITQEKLQEISDAPTIKELSKTSDSKTLFNAYAKEVLTENGQVWSDRTNYSICEKMLRNGVSSQRVKDTLQYSPVKVEKPHSFVTKIEKSPAIKRELQNSRGLER